MSGPAPLTITQEKVDELLSQLITPALLAPFIERHIAQRCQQLTLEEAARYLGAKNVPQLLAFCREHEIPVRHFSVKKRFILLRDIEAAQQRVTVKLPRIERPTTIVRFA